MLKRNKSVLLILLILLCLNNLAQGQRKHSRIHNGWKDTTGTAEIEQTRQKYWDSLPDPTGLTTDFENIFTPEERKKLDSIISDYEKKTSVEFCVVTMDTMNVNRDRFDDLPDYIEKSWGIGKKESQNGIVICISLGYRTIRIGTGKGIADYLSEKETAQIIQKSIIPEFKKQKYYQGTINGIYAITDALDKKMKGKTSAIR